MPYRARSARRSRRTAPTRRRPLTKNDEQPHFREVLGGASLLVRQASSAKPSLSAMARRKKHRVKTDPTPEDDLQLVIDFVRRLRRVALHPLSIGESGQMPGELLQQLRGQAMNIAMKSDDDGTLTSPLPSEVDFESLAVRVRVFTVKSDRLYYVEALNALRRLTGSDNPDVVKSSEILRDMWDRATERPTEQGQLVRGYFVAAEDGAKLTDVDLAWAWLYEDSIHGNEASTGQFGVLMKFAAAVGVFSHMAFVALQTLHHINRLCEFGIIHLPPGTFSDTFGVEHAGRGPAQHHLPVAPAGDVAVGGPGDGDHRLDGVTGGECLGERRNCARHEPVRTAPQYLPPPRPSGTRARRRSRPRRRRNGRRVAEPRGPIRS
jgi:hypothetical protein